MTDVKKLQRVSRRCGPVVARYELGKEGLGSRALGRALEAGLLRRVRRGWYVVVGASASDVELREVCRTLGSVLSHETALIKLGIEVAVAPTSLHATVDRVRGGLVRDGVQVHRSDVEAADRCLVDGVEVTTPIRSLFDLARSRPLAVAVASADSALRLRKVTKPDLYSAMVALPAGRGRRAVRAMVETCDARSESVLESLLRVLLIVHGLAPAELQWVVRGRGGRRIGRVDLCWPDFRLVVEADGFEFHSDRASYRRDRRRGNALTVAGWAYLRFSWEDVALDPDYVVETVRAALADRVATQLAS